ncbi:MULTISPECIES: hypothetical protein [unclassified Shewanella]|uniref:hypothetical protein n=1 Tax=unclassified Shewanella TaxID=196818 RepID=UPI003553226C
MKIIVIVLLVLLGVYLYRRTQNVAKQELEQPESTETEQEPTSVIEGEADTVVAEAEKVDAEPEPEPEPELELEPEPKVEEVVAEAAPVTQAEPAAEVEAETTSEPEAVTAEAEPTLETQPEPATNDLALPTTGAWAGEVFTGLVAKHDVNADTAVQHQSLLNIIGHSYKLRKQAEYCQYGAQLTDIYLSTFEQYQQDNKIAADEKGPGFMQLSTMLNDTKQFDKAIVVCQQAMTYQLSDGTVTGFEGRINRIEKAKSKAGD